VPSSTSPSLALYSLLMKVRPAQLGALLKDVLRIDRCYRITTSGQKYWIDPVSVFGYELWSRGVYEPGLTRIVLGLLSQGDTFLDVGGNEGYFSVLASSRVGKCGAVHCIEPQERLRPVLLENKRINGCEALTVHSLAIGDRDGQVKLFLRPSTNSGASSLFRHWRIGSRRQSVPTLTLTSFCHKNSLERVRLMKVDCEGAENLVIAGGAELLSRQAIDYISMEYHPGICSKESCEHLHQLLKSCGYALARVCGHCMYYRPGLDLEGQLMAVGDVVNGCDWHD
jgi:FkbM family methyltransferase